MVSHNNLTPYTGGNIMKFLTHDGLTYFWSLVKNYIDTSVAKKANSSHTHTKSQITDFPTTMAPTSHTHTKSQITDFPTSMTPAAHNQAASTITAGTFAGQVVAPAGTDYTTARIRNVAFTTTDPGVNASSTLPNGSILIVYE